MQLAQRLEPNCDASSLPLWRRVDRRLSELSGVLLEDGGVADPAAAVQRILEFVDTRAVHDGGGAAGPALLSGGASGGSGVAGRGRTLAAIGVLSAPSVADVGGLLAKLRAAVGVSSAEVLSVAAGSKLQPLIKYIFRDQKAPPVVEKEEATVVDWAAATPPPDLWPKDLDDLFANNLGGARTWAEVEAAMHRLVLYHAVRDTKRSRFLSWRAARDAPRTRARAHASRCSPALQLHFASHTNQLVPNKGMVPPTGTKHRVWYPPDRRHVAPNKGLAPPPTADSAPNKGLAPPQHRTQ